MECRVECNSGGRAFRLSRLGASLSVVHISSVQVASQVAESWVLREGSNIGLHSIRSASRHWRTRFGLHSERGAPLLETARRGGFHSVCTPLDLACASGGRFHSTHEGDSIRAASQRGQSGTVHQKSLIPSIMFAGRRAPVRHRQFAHHRLPTGAVHHHVPKAVNRSRPSPQP